MPGTIGTYSEVDICNLALSELGRGGQIASLDDQNQSARVCKLRYPYDRDAALREYDWNFAGKRALLTTAATTPAFEYGNAWVLPDDFLLLRSIYGYEGDTWAIETQDDGKTILLCNIGSNVPIKYTARVIDPTKFDPLFVQALACRIAADICVTITESSQRAQALWAVYQAKLRQARVRDAMESPPDGDFPVGSWIEARYDW